MILYIHTQFVAILNYSKLLFILCLATISYLIFLLGYVLDTTHVSHLQLLLPFVQQRLKIYVDQWSVDKCPEHVTVINKTILT